MLISDPWFYLTAIPAVLIFGIGKGGLGGALGVIAVPLVSLSVTPTQAAAILLPILCVMDLFAVKQHRSSADRVLLLRMLPGAALGVVVASCFMSSVSESVLRIVVGALCLLFCLQYILGNQGKQKPAGRISAWFWSGLSGFSSTTIHAGGGPASIYLLPLQLEKVTLIATMAVFFASVNAMKLVPFYLMGQFDASNLLTALVLMPLAPVGVKLGVWMLHHVSQTVIYNLCYLFLFISGAKLLADGVLTV
ncbi:sulfite exporter TauE/SafE family protein [Vibrio sp. EA2]|uniref:sulfite exporter TauE/SafE family protein n=1 Tax=Vibrio sp. EA2 TaxID=3079860 RepID=UPI002949F9B5|nr:sulfite exporter TauE/SafE family protein [Vibrio sp. EA2]MDV6254372.1 sulfite exporter TauE/SafE family protein [Vibrio sp. EA2]